VKNCSGRPEAAQTAYGQAGPAGFTLPDRNIPGRRQPDGELQLQLQLQDGELHIPKYSYLNA